MVERAWTRFGGKPTAVSVFKSPAVGGPCWLARTNKYLGARGVFVGAMAVWMAGRDIRLGDDAVGAGRVCRWDGSLVELAGDGLLLVMRWTSALYLLNIYIFF